MKRDDVEAELARHARAHPEDAAMVVRFARLLDDTEAPFSRDQYHPGHLTCSACVLDDTGTRVLLLHHARLDRWLQPGGHVEPGDASPLESASREVEEESGLFDLDRIGRDPIDLDIHEIPARGAEPAHLHYDLRYAFVAPSGAVLAKSDESHALRWIEIDRLGELTDEESVTRLIARTLAAARGGPR